MKEIDHIIKVKEVDALSNIPLPHQQLITSAKEASMAAYAPYSNFPVGAAVLLENGLIIKGNNQENMAYPSGLCAERVAFFAASSQYPHEKIMAAAVYIEKPGPNDVFACPCGSCRQVMYEYEWKQKSSICVYMQVH